MARDLTVRIRANVMDFQNKMRLAQGQIKAFDKDLQSGATRSGKALSALGASYTGVGFAAGAAVASMVKSAADFEQGLANVNATGAVTRAQLDLLEQQALKMGRTTTYSALEATGGMEALLKAGLSAQDVIGGGLTGALNLAAAGEMEVGAAAETASSAMAQFSLRGKDVPHIADLLAAGAGKANGSVADLGMALNQAGLVAAGAGATIEETTATLAAFAKAGLLGSDSGTAMKSMLQRLQAPTGVAAAEMKRLNISAYDANGNFVGLAQIAAQLETAFKGQTDEARNAALATIFGSDAVRAANVLYKEGGDGIRDWTAAVDDAGYAADVAKDKTNTLKGDLDKLQNSWDAFGAGTGGGTGFRPFIQAATDAINKAAEFDRWMNRLGGQDGESDLTRWTDNLFGSDFSGAGKIAAKAGVPREVVVRFKTQNAENAVADATKVARAANLTPKQVRTVLRLQGWDTKKIDAVVAAMGKADRKEVTAHLKLLGFTDKEIKAYFKNLDKESKKDREVPVGAKDTTGRQQVKDFVAWVNTQRSSVYVGTRGPGASLVPGGFSGGRVSDILGVGAMARFAAGGRVPGTPPSDPRKDNVMARTDSGRMLALRSREWVINEKASDLNDRYLHAINSGLDLNKLLPGFSIGGRLNGGSPSGSEPMMARLVDNRVAVGSDGIARIVDDRVQVWMSSDARHSRAAASRRSGS